MNNIGEILIIIAMFGVFSLPFIAGAIMLFSNKHNKAKKI